MLAADPKSPIDMRVEFLETIGRQVDRLLRMIDETMDHARLDDGMPLDCALGAGRARRNQQPRGCTIISRDRRIHCSFRSSV